MRAKWKNIKQKHFFQPHEVNAARKGNVSGKCYINSYNTSVLLPSNGEYEIYDSGVDGIILVCADGTVIDQL